MFLKIFSMQRKKANNTKAVEPQQPPKPLYKGTPKVVPSKQRYVTIEQYYEQVEKAYNLSNALFELKQKILNNTIKKAFVFDITDYKPFTNNNTISLN